MRWEESKKWQHKVETLRGKLAERTKELEKADKTITMLREAVSRSDKDRTGLQTRLKRLDFQCYLVSHKNIRTVCYSI